MAWTLSFKYLEVKSWGKTSNKRLRQNQWNVRKTRRKYCPENNVNKMSQGKIFIKLLNYKLYMDQVIWKKLIIVFRNGNHWWHWCVVSMDWWWQNPHPNGFNWRKGQLDTTNSLKQYSWGILLWGEEKWNGYTHRRRWHQTFLFCLHLK